MTTEQITDNPYLRLKPDYDYHKVISAADRVHSEKLGSTLKSQGLYQATIRLAYELGVVNPEMEIKRMDEQLNATQLEQLLEAAITITTENTSRTMRLPLSRAIWPS